MRIHLHMGMPKTGTSSTQSVLLGAFGSVEPQRIWYPVPERMGDGHADLVARAMGYGNRQPEPQIFEDIARRALAAGCEDLILDSEGFAHAVIAGQRAPFAALARFGEVRPIVTLTALGKRASSIWQEIVKNLAGAALEQSRDRVAEGLVDLPFVTALTQLFAGCTVSVIFVDRGDDPGQLFRNLAAVTGVELPVSALNEPHMRANRSLFRLEADLMAALSASFRGRVGAETEYRYAQFRLLRLFETSDWQSMGPVTPVAYPQEWARWMDELAARTVAGLRALEGAGKVRILGDIARLDDVARPYKWPGVDIHRGAPMVAATIVVSVRTQGDRLHDQLRSAWNQSLTDFELLIVGTGCDAATRSAAHAIVDREPRARFLDHPDATDAHTALHNALGAARGAFVAYLGDDDIWLPHHLQTLFDVLQDADLAHGLQARVDKSGDLDVRPCDLANADLRDFLATTDHRMFGPAVAGHRLDAYRRLPGGWHTIDKDATSPDLAMWRQFLSEPWCRARSAPIPTGISLDEYWRALLAPAAFAEMLAGWRRTCADPDYAAELNRRALTVLNSRSVAAQMAQWRSDAALSGLQAASAKNLKAEAGRAAIDQTRAASMAEQIAAAQQAREDSKAALRRAQARVAQLRRKLSRERSRRAEIKQSLSWRMTRPLRRLLRKLIGGDT